MEDNINFCTVCGNNLNTQKEEPKFGSLIKVFALIFTIIYLVFYLYFIAFALLAMILAFPLSGLAGYESASDFFISGIGDTLSFGASALFMPPLVFLVLPAFIFSVLSIKATKKLLIFNSIFLSINLVIFLIFKFGQF